MKTASIFSLLNIFIAASPLASFLAQSRYDPVTFKTCLLRGFITTFPMTRLTTSTILIGLTPDYSSKGINLNAKKASGCFAVSYRHSRWVISAIVFCFVVVFFFYLDFLSRTFTIHRTAGEGASNLFKSSLPLPPASQTLRR